MGKKIKVLVKLVVTVDVDDYALNYGVEDAATIRNDVKYAVLGAVVDGSVLANGIVADETELKNK